MIGLIAYDPARIARAPVDTPRAAPRFALPETLRACTRDSLQRDLTAAAVVAVVLIPTALAYAVLAGLPPHVGLHASMLPLLAYALFGRSRIVSVGPVTIVSLMTASALAPFAAAGPATYLAMAGTLALVSAAFLWAASLVNIGGLVASLRHSALSAFLTAVGVIIIASQAKHLVGVPVPAASSPTLTVMHLVGAVPQWSWVTAAIAMGALTALLWKAELVAAAVRWRLLPSVVAPAVVRAMPLIVVVAAIVAAIGLDLKARGVAVVGALPETLPTVTLPHVSVGAVTSLLLPAALLSAIGFLECLSVLKGLEPRSGERLDLPAELRGLAAANAAAALSGSYPVSGGTIRSVVNFNAGAASPLANAFTGLIVIGISLLFGRFLAHLPMAVLAAIVTAAAWSVIDIKGLSLWCREAQAPQRLSALGTFATCLLTSVELGLLAAIALSCVSDRALSRSWRVARRIQIVAQHKITQHTMTRSIWRFVPEPSRKTAAAKA